MNNNYFGQIFFVKKLKYKFYLLKAQCAHVSHIFISSALPFVQLLILPPYYFRAFGRGWWFISSRLSLQVRANILPLRPIEQEGPVRSILKIRFVICSSKIINVVIKKSQVTPSGFGIMMPKAVLKWFVNRSRNLLLPSVGTDRVVIR